MINQRLFEYSGDILQLLALPYNMFQDLIIKQLSLKKKEVENTKNSLNTNEKLAARYPKMKRTPPGAGFQMPAKLKK